MDQSAFYMECLRKHFFNDKTYNLRLTDKCLQLSDQVNFASPKYQINFDFGNVVYWKSDPPNIIAFGLRINKELKWFYASPASLLELYRRLQCRLFFGHIQSIYESQQLLGTGASSKVYKVFNKITKQEFASKCIRKDYIFKRNDNERYNRLLLEIEIMKQLDNPYVVKIHEAYEGEKSYYLILELLRGESLSNYIKRQPLTLQQVKDVTYKCLKALSYMNESGIMHRDLKTENIVLAVPNKLETIKIIDFGLACHLDYNMKQLCGTPGFIAPEMFFDRFPYTSKVDVFSLGAIMYKLITNKSLFSGATSDDVLENNRKLRFTNHLRDQFSGTSDLIRGLLAKNPANRLTADDALLHHFYGDSQIDLGVADESPHEIVRHFPQLNLMQQSNAFNDMSPDKLNAIKDSQDQILSKSSYFPSLLSDKAIQLIGETGIQGSDHIIE